MLIQFIAVVAWLAGVILAKGFWLSLCAIFLPPTAWYLLIEKLMQMAGMV